MTAAVYRAPSRCTTFTTGEVGKITDLAPKTITKFIDSGQLKGYRIPGSKDRRVTRDSLLRFLRENDFPAAMMDAVQPPILLVGAPPAIADACQASAPDLRWLHAADSFGAGWLAGQHRPAIVIVDAGTLGCLHAAGLGVLLRAALPDATLIAVASLDGPPPGEWAAVLPAPLEPRRLLDALEGE